MGGGIRFGLAPVELDNRSSVDFDCALTTVLGVLRPLEAERSEVNKFSVDFEPKKNCSRGDRRADGDFDIAFANSVYSSVLLLSRNASRNGFSLSISVDTVTFSGCGGGL